MIQIKIEGFLADFATRSQDTPAEATALQGLCPFDWRVWYYSVQVAKTPDEELNDARQSVEAGPTVVGYHRLASVLRQANKPSEAIAELTTSLKLDPNNLAALQLMLDIQKETSPADAVKTAERMVAIEPTTYFSVRAIPEVVPTETYEARIYLASLEKAPAKITDLLKPAVQGLIAYAATTVPMIVRFEAVGGAQFGSPKEAVNIISDGVTAARALAANYRLEKDENAAKWADDAVGSFEAALAGLDKSPNLSK
jgi:tetratricopeptide (TPR) repeat protein